MGGPVAGLSRFFDPGAVSRRRTEMASRPTEEFQCRSRAGRVDERLGRVAVAVAFAPAVAVAQYQAAPAHQVCRLVDLDRGSGTGQGMALQRPARPARSRRPTCRSVCCWAAARSWLCPAPARHVTRHVQRPVPRLTRDPVPGCAGSGSVDRTARSSPFVFNISLHSIPDPVSWTHGAETFERQGWAKASGARRPRRVRPARHVGSSAPVSGSRIETVSIMPLSSWNRLWQCSTNSPVKSTCLLAITTMVPGRKVASSLFFFGPPSK